MKNIVYYIAIATVLLFASCASELDTEPSGSQVSDEQLGELIKENADLVLAPMMQGAVNYMHTGNRQATTNDRGFMVWNLGMDLQGNDMVLTKLTNWFADEYMFESIRAQTNAYTADRWSCYYKIVYQSNQILDLIPDDVTGKALVYKAQALTYRALAYYYLMCVYQDDYMHGGKDKAGVPLYLTVEGAKGRTPSTEVYSTITTDLQNGTDDGRLHYGSQCCRGGDFGRLLAHERGAVYDFGFPEHFASRDHLGLYVGCFHFARQPFLRIVHVDHGRGQCQQQGYLHGHRRPALQPDRRYRLPQEEFQRDRDHGRGFHLSGLLERQVQHPDLRG